MKLLTVADGFGDSNAYPSWYPGFYRWPEIIKFMTKDLDLINLSRYGAGNEYIINCIKNCATDKDAILVQWAMPNRLDLVLDHPTNFWQEEINTDSIYSNNVVTVNNIKFWLSSGSKNKNIQEYHKTYIGLKQHQLRSQLFVDYATLLLEKQNVNYKFLLTTDSEYLKETVLNFDHWCWHNPFKGMDSFRKISRFVDLDLVFNLTQPISLVQFDFVKQYIMPSLDLNWRSNRDIDAVENMLHRKYKEALKVKPE